MFNSKQIIHGDCLEVLKTFPDNSIDSFVSDPPAGISMMGAKWDSDKGGRKQWCAYMEERFAEALRVCKPGAHALVWALPRTSHWTATALEDAGWEIRDTICHIRGDGFPKSLDIGKKIDEMAGSEREVIGERIKRGDKKAYSNQVTGNVYGKNNGELYSGFRPPLTAPATPEAKSWDGYGTGLKPSHENWILCRKPIEGTIAQNCLTHGVGGIHIDRCRVDYASDYDQKHQEDIARGQENATNGRMFGSSATRSEASSLVMKGRWPSNLVLSHLPECTASDCVDGCAVAELDKQGGIRKSGGGVKTKINPNKSKNTFSKFEIKTEKEFSSSEGIASRYFPVFHYFPKASQSDRTCNQAVENNHPTVKNRALMRWLVKLITPSGGTVLDMFGGSGSTAIACLEEGFNYILIEQDADFVEIAKARVHAWQNENKHLLTTEERLQWLETQVKAQSAKIRKIEQNQQMSIFDIA